MALLYWLVNCPRYSRWSLLKYAFLLPWQGALVSSLFWQLCIVQENSLCCDLGRSFEYNAQVKNVMPPKMMLTHPPEFWKPNNKFKNKISSENEILDWTLRSPRLKARFISPSSTSTSCRTWPWREELRQSPQSWHTRYISKRFWI